jgi:hypothetical protein
MNGYTSTTPLNTRLANLAKQIPQECRALALAECLTDDGNPHGFERRLTGYVLCKTWEGMALVHTFHDFNPQDDEAAIDELVGTEPSPYISGGEVFYTTGVKSLNGEIPF